MYRRTNERSIVYNNSKIKLTTFNWPMISKRPISKYPYPVKKKKKLDILKKIVVPGAWKGKY